MGMRAGREGAASMECTMLADESRTGAPSLGPSAGGHFSGMPLRSLHARGAAAPDDDCRMAAVCGLAVPKHASRRPPPVVRRRDRRRADGDAGRAEGAA
jgi:hypothetical protein